MFKIEPVTVTVTVPGLSPITLNRDLTASSDRQFPPVFGFL
jgi:hypothetical protein